MSLWLTTGPCSERLADTPMTVRWHRQIGFGWYVCEAWAGPTKLHQYTRADFETARALARDRCEIAAGEPA